MRMPSGKLMTPCRLCFLLMFHIVDVDKVFISRAFSSSSTGLLNCFIMCSRLRELCGGCRYAGYDWMRYIVALGACVGIFTSVGVGIFRLVSNALSAAAGIKDRTSTACTCLQRCCDGSTPGCQGIASLRCVETFVNNVDVFQTALMTLAWFWSAAWRVPSPPWRVSA